MQRIDISIESTICLFYSSIASNKTNKSSMHSIVRDRMQFFWHQTTSLTAFLISFSTFRWRHQLKICSFFNLITSTTKNRQCIRWFQHRMQFSTFHRERHLINGFSQQTIVNVHLIVSQSNAAVWQSNNFANAFDRSRSNAIIWHQQTMVSAFDDIDIRCSFDNFINKQSPACIWPFHGRMQPFWHHIQPSVHLMTSASNAALAIRQSSVHLTLSRSDAAFRTSIATHLIAVGLSATVWHRDNRQCIWWHRHQMQHFGITFIWTISLRHRRTVDRLLYTFIWSNFFTKRHQSSAFWSNHFHIVSICNFSERSFQRFNKRLFRTVISCSQNGSKFDFISFYLRSVFQFFNFSSFLLQVQRSRHSRMATDVPQIKGTTSRIESIKKKRS